MSDYSKPAPGYGGTTPITRSPYGCCAKQCYAMGLLAAYIVPFACGGFRQIYMLNFGAKVETMAICFSVINFWGAANELLLGWLQDKEVLGSCFSREKWGRRTPWLILGTIFGALMIVLGSLASQLNFQGNALPGMYFFVNFVASLCYSSIGIAFSSATIELFAFNEERMEVEGMSIVSALLGVIIGTFYLALGLGDTGALFPIGVVVALLCFVSMLGVPLMKDAKMPANKDAIGTYFTTVASCFTTNKAFCIYFAAQFFDGFATQILPLFYIEWIQFVVEANNQERTTYFLLVLCVTLLTQLSMGIFLGGFVFNSEGRTDLLRWSAIGMRILDIVGTIVIFQVAPNGSKSDSWKLMLGFQFFTRFCYSFRTFWSTAARDWAIDEDIHVNFKGGAQEQMRKEAAYASMARFAGNLGQAISATAFFYGLYGAGFDVEDCRPFGSLKFGTTQGMDYYLIENSLQENYDEGFGIPPCTKAAANHTYSAACCIPRDQELENWGNLTTTNHSVAEYTSVFKYETFAECCYEQIRITQPASVRKYIIDMWAWAMPISHIFSLIFMVLFPIHGPRLDKLYAAQHNVLEDAKAYKAKQQKNAAVAYSGTEAVLAQKVSK